MEAEWGRWETTERHIPSSCERVRRKMPPSPPDAPCLPAVVLSSEQRPDFRPLVENVLTALCFQRATSYWEEKKPTDLWRWSGVCSSQLLLILAAQKGPCILSAEEQQQWGESFKGLISSLASPLPREWASDQQAPACQLVACRDQQADRETLMFCAYSWKRGKRLITI